MWLVFQSKDNQGTKYTRHEILLKDIVDPQVAFCFMHVEEQICAKY